MGKIVLDSVKSSDGWSDLCYEVLFDKFKEQHMTLSEDEVDLKFYNEVVCKVFKYGEYAKLELTFDENFNITGKIIPHKSL